METVTAALARTRSHTSPLSLALRVTAARLRMKARDPRPKGPWRSFVAIQ